MNHRNVTNVILLVSTTLAATVGCGGPTTSQPISPKVLESGTENNSTLPSEIPPAVNSVLGEPESTETPTLAKIASTQQVATQPTSQQLARWKLVDFVPLQLVGYREHDNLGFVNFVAAVHGGQEYLLGGTRLTLCSLKDSSRIHEFIEAKTQEKERLLSFAISPDGTWCVAGDAGGLIRKFDIPGRRLISSKQTGTNAITRVAISPDGKELATLPYVSEVSVWDADTLEKKNSFKVDAREVKHVQYTKANDLIVAGESMSTWNTVNGQKLKTYPAQKYQSAIAISADYKQLVFGAKDTLQRWNLEEDKTNGEYRGVPYRNAAVRFTDDGSLVAVAGADGVRIVDANSGQMLQVMDASGSAVTDICWIPQSHVLQVGTERARNRIWGRPDECRKLGIEPLSNTKIRFQGGSNEPSGVAQNLAMLDLRSLPKLPDAKSQSDSFSTVSYTVASDQNEVTSFYRYVLGQRGWTESSDQPSDSSLVFLKDGHGLYLSPYSIQPNETTISLSHLGNHDLTKAPRFPNAQQVVYSGATTVIYKVEASLLKIETELLKAFHSAGWTNIARLNRSQNQNADGRDLEFLKGGTVLRVMVQPDPKDGKLFIVNYSQLLTMHALPVPPDAGLMEWDDAAECQMVANTFSSLEAATAFYVTEMPKQGWIARDKGRRIDKETAYLPYYRGQHDVTVALESVPGGMVRIQAGKYSETSWQKPNEQGDSIEVEKDVSDKVNQPTENTGIEAADVPVLHAANQATYDSARGKIHFELDTPALFEVAKEYEAAMGKIGWTVEPFGEPTSNSVNLIFKRDSESIYYQSSVDPRGKSHVSFEGGGLLWGKAIDSPQIISYQAWLRSRKLPASLRSLDEYEIQMQKLAR